MRGIIFIHTSADKISACTIAEVMKYSITMILQHFGMNVKTGVAKFSNFLGQQFNTIDWIAEDDGLVNL